MDVVQALRFTNETKEAAIVIRELQELRELQERTLQGSPHQTFAKLADTDVVRVLKLERETRREAIVILKRERLQNLQGDAMTLRMDVAQELTWRSVMHLGRIV